MPATPPRADEPAATLKQIEQMLAAQGPALEKTAPRQLEQLRALARELRATPRGQKPSASAQKVIRALFAWQLDEKRAGYVARIEALRTQVAALQEMVRVIDEARKALGDAAGAPQALEAVAAAADRASASLVAAAEPRSDRTRSAAPAPLGPFKAPLPGSKLSVPLPAAASRGGPGRGRKA
jgi:hypothetical protein